MNYRNIIYSLSMLMLVIGGGMFATVYVGYYCKDSDAHLLSMTFSAGATLLFSLIGILFSARGDRSSRRTSEAREGFIIISLAWLMAILFGSIPFILCQNFTVADAIFETASGFTTTGASVIDTELVLRTGEKLTGGLESLPQCLLFWRSMLNWLGGIGFVMFILMILPALGGGKQLYNAEVPGLKTFGDQLTPRLATTARLMLACYIVWTAIVVVTYRLLGMTSWFEAVCHAFTTVSTGGFSTHAASFGFFTRPALQWASTFFMLVSSFNLLYLLKLFFFGKFEFHKDEEIRWFLTLAIVAALIFSIQLFIQKKPFEMTNGDMSQPKWEPIIRTTTFHVVSVMSTTGYTTSDYINWNLPGLPALLLFLMLLGGCGGSTAGGLKIVRLIVIFKQSLIELKRRIFPHLVPNVRVGATSVEQSVVQQTMGFLFLYIGTIVIGTLILPYICQMDFETAFSSTMTAVSNVGPGIGRISPSYTFSWMNAPAKLLLSFAMIAGRLELYTVFIVLSPYFWRTHLIFTSRK